MNKQIEEMKNNARIYIGAIVEKLRIDGCELWEIDGIVENILNYITIAEDSVVLSREEYNNLKLEIQKALHKGIRVGFDLTKYKENSIEQAVKEFVEKLRKNLDNFKSDIIIYDSELSNLAKEIYIKQLDFIKERMIDETLKEVIGEKE